MRAEQEADICRVEIAIDGFDYRSCKS